jgi:hypothetical protein
MTTRTIALPASFHVAALGLFLLSVSACASAAPAAPAATPAAAAQPAAPTAKPVAVVEVEPKFAAPATAKAALVGSLVAVAPSKLVGDLDALSKRLSLPMLLGRELLSSLGGLGLAGDSVHFQQLWDRVDASAPIAVVWILPPNASAKGYCAAVTFRDRAGAKRTLDEMGSPGQQRSGIVERVSASGDKLWGSVKGRTLFVSGSADALLLAGGLAEAAQIPPEKGQMVLTMLPQALAKASGKTPAAMVAQMANLVAGEAQTAPGKTAPPLQRMIVALTEVATKLVMDSTAVHLRFEVGTNDGVMIQTEFVPAAGTDFAGRTAHRTPYAFDSRLPVKNDGTAAFAIGDWSAWMAAAAKVFEATGAAGRTMLKDTDKMLGMTSGWSCVVDSAEAGFSTLCSSSLKPGSTGKAALDAAVAMMTAQHAWEAELEGRKASPLKIKHTRDVVEIEKKIENKDATARAVAKAMAGGDTLRYALTIKDQRLLMVTGHDARKALARYGAGGSTSGAPLFAATLARTKGDEMMASVDVISFVLRVLGQGKDLPGKEMAMMAGAMPGVAEMTAPFTVAMRGGNSLVGEFRIPLGSLENVAKVVRGMLGAPPASEK